jgi:hypothetical protein
MRAPAPSEQTDCLLQYAKIVVAQPADQLNHPAAEIRARLLVEFNAEL